MTDIIAYLVGFGSIAALALLYVYADHLGDGNVGADK